MSYWHIIVCCAFTFHLVASAALADDGDVDKQGLYSKSDHVVILTEKNFERKVYGQKHAQVIQFYNSFCGHCRAFAPKYKGLAAEIVPWQPIIRLEVVDCSVEDNVEICRQFEIMAYPSIRYIHENYVKGNANIGDKIRPVDTAEKLKMHIISKMHSEQLAGRLSSAPPLGIAAYDSYSAAVSDVPRNIDYVFLIFEYANSTVGTEITLDINDYEHVRVKRLLDSSALTQVAGVTHFPSIIAYTQLTSQSTPLTTASVEKLDFLKAIKAFLTSKNYKFPSRATFDEDMNSDDFDNHQILDPKPDTVYYNDLEKTIKISLHTEVSRYKTLDGEPLQALLNYLKVLISTFPARANLKEYLVELHDTLNANTEWNGNDVYEMVKSLEVAHAPVYTSNSEYIACKGSQQKFRGYTCGLWTLYHTLTVNAAALTTLTEGPKVLQAMHGYVKHFFGCTECAQHFQAMAARNRLFDVKENDKAILWLWISHNEVNLRLAGDVTEDPEHPKIQFPSAKNCPECRLARGAWNLPAVYQYLQKVYGASNIQGSRKARSEATVTSPFTNLDIGMLSFLYILSFIILILVIKYFLTKRFYRNRYYKHGRGKV